MTEAQFDNALEALNEIHNRLAEISLCLKATLASNLKLNADELYRFETLHGKKFIFDENLDEQRFCNEMLLLGFSETDGLYSYDPETKDSSPIRKMKEKRNANSNKLRS